MDDIMFSFCIISAREEVILCPPTEHFSALRGTVWLRVCARVCGDVSLTHSEEAKVMQFLQSQRSFQGKYALKDQRFSSKFLVLFGGFFVLFFLNH